MKKLVYFSTIFIALTLMNFSCTKPNDDKTLAEQNPTWANLSWVSTDGSTTSYPRLDIKIEGNVASIFETRNSTEGKFTYTYGALEVIAPTTSSNGIATFFMPGNGSIAQTMTILMVTPNDGTKVKLIWQSHTYLLKVN